MKLMLDDNFELENIIELNESTNEKVYVIKGTFSTPGVKNRNGRIYPLSLWEDNVEQYQYELVNKTVNTLMEKEHPPRTNVDPWSAVAQIRLLEMRDGLVYGEAELLNIPETLVMRSLIDKGVKIGVSTRGVGKLGKDNLVEEYKLITVDIVSTPSDYNANLKGFNESMLLESFNFESDNKGGWICTPEGCTLSEGSVAGDVAVAVGGKDEKHPEGCKCDECKKKHEDKHEEKLDEALLENMKCSECKKSGMSYVTENGNLNVKCKSCGYSTSIKNIQKGLAEAVSEDVNAEFWEAFNKVEAQLGKKAKKQFQKLGNELNQVIASDYEGEYNESEKSCVCKAKELTELFDALANKKELVARQEKQVKLEERFNELTGSFINEKSIDKEVIKRLKKGSVMIITPDDILVSVDDYDDGYFTGLDQFDNDFEDNDLKGYRLDEGEVK